MSRTRPSRLGVRSTRAIRISLPMSPWADAVVVVRKYAATDMFEVRETSLLSIQKSVGRPRPIKMSDAQISPVVPHRVGQVSPQGVNQNLVLIEFEDDVGQPPIALALKAFSIACRSARGSTRFECLADGVGDLGAWRESEPATYRGRCDGRSNQGRRRDREWFELTREDANSEHSRAELAAVTRRFWRRGSGGYGRH